MYSKKQITLVSNILKANKTNYWTGNECKKFEEEFSTYHKIKYSIAVSNGSVALELALKSLNLKKNDEIIVTPRSFVASASCVLNLGLKPVFADLDENGNLNIKGISEAYTKRVKAIVLVHLNGLPCDLDPIVGFAKNRNLFIIEDCSQSHGAKYKGKSVGSFGDVATWSFCQDKIISTGGEGGMISTNNKKIWKKCWSFKDHGKNYNKVFYKKKNLGFRWLHDQLGSNYRMTEMQAAIGRLQLKKLDSQIKKRNLIANMYIKKLNLFFREGGLFKNINLKYNCVHAFYRLNFFINSKKVSQLKLIKELNDHKIDAIVGACPEIYREKIFRKLKFYPKKRLPMAKLLGRTSITFRIDPYISLNIVKRNIQIVNRVLSKYL